MEIFSAEDYYPTASGKVISYKLPCLFQKRRAVLTADLVALIVHLTSPIDSVDYSMFADFFLVYRNFMTCLDLGDILIARFNWCVKQITTQWDSNYVDERYDPKKIGEIALVRTFVLLRHWLLNFFNEDFLTSAPLRLRFLNFLNDKSWKSSGKIIKSSISSLKKIWLKKYHALLGEEDVVVEDWSEVVVKDFTDQVSNSGSSLNALKRMSSPEYRNNSVLSLYKNLESIRLPEYPVKHKKRISALLFPKDSSNIPNHGGTVTDVTQTNKSHLMKSIKYPSGSHLDTIVPPTPVKNVEIILNSNYILDDEESMDGINSESMVHNSERLSTSFTQLNKNAMALLKQWKMNHDNSMTQFNESNGFNPRPHMDTFVKYVISISSLKSKTDITEEMNTLLSSKFDILSARTIDEVEFLVSLENSLLGKLKFNYADYKNSQEKLVVEEPNDLQLGFSSMDNLDLFGTVNSLASSVIKLSKTLQQKEKLTESPLSHVSKNRKKIRSALTFGIHNKTTDLARSQGVRHSNTLDDLPKKLLFNSEPNSKVALLTMKEKPVNSSPLKQLISTEKPSSTSEVEYKSNNESYDSLLTFGTPKSSDTVTTTNLENQHASFKLSSHSSLDQVPVLKLKSSEDKLNNKFSFEEYSPKLLKRVALLESQDNVVKQSSDIDAGLIFSSVRPMSGRISITKKQGIEVSHKRATMPAMKSSKYISKAENYHSTDEIDDVEASTALNNFHNISESTSLGSSPEPTKKLSMVPSIASIETNDMSFTSKDDSAKRSHLSKNLEMDLDKIINLRQQFQEDIKLDNNNDNKINANASINTDIRSEAEPDNNLEVGLDDVLNFKSNTKSDTKSDTKLDVKSDTKSDIKSDINSNINSDSRSEVKSNIKSDLRSEIKSNIKSDTKSENVSNVLFQNDTNRLFASEFDTTTLASPPKDFEKLKNRFLKSEEKSITSTSGIEIDQELASEQDESIISSNNELDLINLMNRDSNGTEYEDPLLVAMLKLEGKFEGKKPTNASVNSLEKKIERWRISDIPNLRQNINSKRNSLFIKRRRQTVMDIPYTPKSSFDDAKNENEVVTTAKIREIFKEYKMNDQRLLLGNKSEHIPFILMHDSLSIAQQLTMIEKELLLEVDWEDLMNLKITHEPMSCTSWLQLLIQNENISGIDLAISRFNLTVDWIVSEIALTEDIKLRRNTIQRFIHVAKHCHNLQNFNTMMQVILALNSTIVQKYVEAWRLIEPVDLISWEELKLFSSPEFHYSAVKELLNDCDPLEGCIPFIVVYLSDLSFNSNKRDWIIEDLVLNYTKFDTNVQIVKHFLQKVHWSKLYNFDLNQSLLSKCVYISTLTKPELAALST